MPPKCLQNPPGNPEKTTLKIEAILGSDLQTPGACIRDLRGCHPPWKTPQFSQSSNLREGDGVALKGAFRNLSLHGGTESAKQVAPNINCALTVVALMALDVTCAFIVVSL